MHGDPARDGDAYGRDLSLPVDPHTDVGCGVTLQPEVCESAHQDLLQRVHVPSYLVPE